MELNQLVETCVSREEIYEGVVLHVVKDTVRLPNGALAPREFCLHPGAVAILALCDDGTVLMEHQYRYAHGRVFYEIPAGKLDRRDEPPLLAAARELREDTGAIAEKFTYLGPIETTPALLDERIHLYLAEGLSFGERELDEEQAFWTEFVHTRVPRAYDGIRELIRDFKAEGGIVAVSSHSMNEFIERDYRENDLPFPDAIFGWDLPRDKRKPSTYTVDELIRRYGFDKSEILMVDDLKPGFDMARAAGIDFAAAGWGYDVEQIRAFMTEHSDFYLESVAELRELVFGSDETNQA